MALAILVTDGTGRLGSRVVTRLVEAGATVRVLTHSRTGPDGVELFAGDLTTGVGIDAALAGVGTVVHCAGSAKGDEAMARTLVAAAQKAGVGHVLYSSVVGAERVPVVSGLDRMAFGYFAAKRAAELLLENSGLPYSILRTTQFQESMLAVARQMAKSPVIPAPTGSRFQPVAVDEVAARLAELALGEPAGLVAEMGGPTAFPHRRTGPWLPDCRAPAPPICARAHARQGCRCDPGRSEPHTEPGRGRPDMGGTAGLRGRRLKPAGTTCSTRCAVSSRSRRWPRTG